MNKLFIKLKLGLLSLSILASLSLQAQSVSTIDYTNVREGESVEYCKTHKFLNELKKDPAFAAQHAIDQEKMRLKEVEMKNSISPKGVIYKIPVVFHVLHNGGTENISNEQIMDALFILNRDFRLQNADANNVINAFNASNLSATCTPADSEIEFVLATKAPNGVCFSGITRTQDARTVAPTSNGGGQQVTAIRNGNDVYNGEWPGNKYMNIFIAKEIGGAAGYTFNPGTWNANAMGNGIWILHNYVGSIGTGNINTSRALTHEVGHWLNLSHTWGPNNNPGNASSCSDDDGVTDTPNTIGVTSCKLNENSCGELANVENYMDYSYCSKMFSHGQADRMRAALNVSSTGRKNLWQAANLTATGADGNATLCKAEFNTDRQIICAGEAIDFTDASFNVVNGWSWSFPGGSPATSTAQNPTVTYATPGTYAVTLTASAGGSSETTTKTAYIKVLPASTTLPYHEGFEGYSQTSDITSYEFVNSTNNAGWALTTSAANSGSQSLKLENYTQSGTENYDEFSSSSIDLSSITANPGVTLSFRYAYRKKAANNIESLKVFISENCGESWAQRKTISGNALSTFAETTNWTPTPADWVTVHMTNVTSQFWTANFRYKFRFEGKGGNNIFIDDINIYKGSPSDDILLGMEELPLIDGLSLYPNPTDGELNVSFNIPSNQTMNFIVTDLLGKVVQTKNIQAASGSNLVVLSTDGLANGMYLLQIGNNTSKQVVQFVVK